MKSPSFVRNKPPSETGAAIDLDVTPLISMFIILIPFLVSMAVLTHLSILEFSVPPNVGAGLDASAGKPKLKLTVVVARSYLGITYGASMLDSLPVGPNGYEFDSLSAKLTERRKTADITDEVVVAVSDSIAMKNVVRVMDKCRSVGFSKVGLSSAVDNPVRGD